MKTKESEKEIARKDVLKKIKDWNIEHGRVSWKNSETKCYFVWDFIYDRLKIEGTRFFKAQRNEFYFSKHIPTDTIKSWGGGAYIAYALGLITKKKYRSKTT